MPMINVSSLRTMWRVTLLQNCDTVSSRGGSLGPAYAVAISADPAWLRRTWRLLGRYGVCPIYHVDRAEGVTTEVAVNAVEKSLRNVTALAKPRHWNSRGSRDAESTYSHLLAWDHFNTVHPEAALGLFVEEVAQQPEVGLPSMPWFMSRSFPTASMH